MGRRKGSSAFPVARIKKMMQADDDVGKIATVTPVLVAKALECMMEHVLTEAADVAHCRQTRTVTPQHLKACVSTNDHFDFLRPTLAHVPALEEGRGGDGGGGGSGGMRIRAKRARPPANARSTTVTKEDDGSAGSESASKEAVEGKRPKVREMVAPPVVEAMVAVGVAGGVSVGVGEEDEDEYDEDDEGEDHGGDEGIGEGTKGSERVSVHALLS